MKSFLVDGFGYQRKVIVLLITAIAIVLKVTVIVLKVTVIVLKVTVIYYQKTSTQAVSFKVYNDIAAIEQM